MQIRDEVQYRKPEELNPHPLNDFYHSPLEEGEHAALVASIEELGIQESLWITPDGMIISGHERWKIAKKLGLDRVPVRLVENAVDQEIRYLLISANEARRGTEKDLIRKARKVKVLYDHWGIRHGNNQKRHGVASSQDAADYFGQTKRTLQRLLKLLELIPELQDLVSREVIGLTAGNELAALPEDEQKLIYQYIRREEIKEVKTVEIQAIRKELEYLRERKPASLKDEQKPADTHTERESADMTYDEWDEDFEDDLEEEESHSSCPPAPSEGEDQLYNAEEYPDSPLPSAPSKPEEEERPWHGPDEPRKRAIDAVAPMFDERNAVNVRRRVMMSQIEKAGKQVEALGKSLLPFFDDMVDNQDFVVREAVDSLTKQLENLSDKLKEVVDWK